MIFNSYQLNIYSFSLSFPIDSKVTVNILNSLIYETKEFIRNINHAHTSDLDDHVQKTESSLREMISRNISGVLMPVKKEGCMLKSGPRLSDSSPMKSPSPISKLPQTTGVPQSHPNHNHIPSPTTSRVSNTFPRPSKSPSTSRLDTPKLRPRESPSTCKVNNISPSHSSSSLTPSSENDASINSNAAIEKVFCTLNQIYKQMDTFM